MNILSIYKYILDSLPDSCLLSSPDIQFVFLKQLTI